MQSKEEGKLGMSEATDRAARLLSPARQLHDNEYLHMRQAQQQLIKPPSRVGGQVHAQSVQNIYVLAMKGQATQKGMLFMLTPDG